MHIVNILNIGFTWVYLGSLGLILVDVGHLGYRALNLENEQHTNTGFLGCFDILSDLIRDCEGQQFNFVNSYWF